MVHVLRRQRPLRFRFGGGFVRRQGEEYREVNHKFVIHRAIHGPRGCSSPTTWHCTGQGMSIASRKITHQPHENTEEPLPATLQLTCNFWPPRSSCSISSQPPLQGHELAKRSAHRRLRPSRQVVMRSATPHDSHMVPSCTAGKKVLEREWGTWCR